MIRNGSDSLGLSSNPKNCTDEDKFKHEKMCHFQYALVPRSFKFEEFDELYSKDQKIKKIVAYCQDIFTTLVDAQWRWTLLVFSMNFLLSWLGFALVWWLIVYTHGDLDPKNRNNPNVTFTPCVEDIHGFTSCFLFSVETQHTIG